MTRSKRAAREEPGGAEPPPSSLVMPTEPAVLPFGTMPVTYKAIGVLVAVGALVVIWLAGTALGPTPMYISDPDNDFVIPRASDPVAGESESASESAPTHPSASATPSSRPKKR